MGRGVGGRGGPARRVAAGPGARAVPSPGEHIAQVRPAGGSGGAGRSAEGRLGAGPAVLSADAAARRLAGASDRDAGAAGRPALSSPDGGFAGLRHAAEHALDAGSGRGFDPRAARGDPGARARGSVAVGGSRLAGGRFGGPVADNGGAGCGAAAGRALTADPVHDGRATPATRQERAGEDELIEHPRELVDGDVVAAVLGPHARHLLAATQAVASPAEVRGEQRLVSQTRRGSSTVPDAVPRVASSATAAGRVSAPAIGSTPRPYVDHPAGARGVRNVTFPIGGPARLDDVDARAIEIGDEPAELRTREITVRTRGTHHHRACDGAKP